MLLHAYEYLSTWYSYAASLCRIDQIATRSRLKARGPMMREPRAACMMRDLSS